MDVEELTNLFYQRKWQNVTLIFVKMQRSYESPLTFRIG